MPMKPQLAGKKIVRHAERRRQAMELRALGHSYERIGKAIGVNTVTAWRLVQSGLEKCRLRTAESAESVRDVEVRRLDMIVAALMPKRDDPQASNTILKASERRSKLLGLDAPQKTEVEIVRGMSDEQLILAAKPIFDRARALGAGGDGAEEREQHLRIDGLHSEADEGVQEAEASGPAGGRPGEGG